MINSANKLRAHSPRAGRENGMSKRAGTPFRSGLLAAQLFPRYEIGAMEECLFVGRLRRYDAAYPGKGVTSVRILRINSGTGSDRREL